ncbi:hypothetical protein BGX21_009708 [Mortierella sp. AD011]|nr:hypothetical protein BGX21_009708 [Mortierella sp. AD011]
MLNFDEFILQSEDPRKKSFHFFYRSYVDYVNAQCRKLNQRHTRLSLKTQLGVYEQVLAELNKADERKEAQIAATESSTEAMKSSKEATNAAATMIRSSLKYTAASHLGMSHSLLGSHMISGKSNTFGTLEMLKRANESSDDDFERPPSISAAKKRKPEHQSTTDPWADLEKASTSLHNGERGVHLPKIPTNLPPNHLLLFKIAHGYLTEANGPFKKVTDAVNLKDALIRGLSWIRGLNMDRIQLKANPDPTHGLRIGSGSGRGVAMSCILNLRSPSAPANFPARFVAKATDDCYEDGYDSNVLVSKCFAGMTDVFNAEGVLGLRDAAEDMKAVYKKQRQACDSPVRSLEEKLMDVIEIACDLVSEKQFEEPRAEADTLHIWLKIFEKLLPARLRMKTGESVLTCSKPGMQQKDEDIMGRKVDLKFLFDGIEVAVIEFKSASQAKGAVAKQSRKSLRLGKNILQSLEALGVEDAYVVCGDVAGFMGSFTKVMCFEDIYVAGKITDTIVTLPTTKHTLLKFLEGKPVSVLLNFLNYLDDLGSRAIDAREAAAVLADEEEFEQQIEYRKPIVLKEKKSFQQSVVHSPTLKSGQPRRRKE